MTRFPNSRTLVLLVLTAAVVGAVSYELGVKNGIQEGLNRVAAQAPQQPEARDALPPADEAGPMPGAPSQDDTALANPAGPGGVQAQPGVQPPKRVDDSVAFAHQTAGLIQEAMESENDAREAFSELEQCADNLDGSMTTQDRLICLANAKILAEQHPQALNGKMKNLMARNNQLSRTLDSTGL